jgi:uroporphyrin-III C-methyltransferase
VKFSSKNFVIITPCKFAGMNTPSKVLGKVILAAAGPGDPDLITVKALRYLKQADVVITDRLVSPELLKEMKAGAVLIEVGKQSSKELSTSQEAINKLLIERASLHALVLRLKGGDTSFFSNILDELRTLRQHGISYEIVPGVTAASGAAAYAGIPLTARGYSTAVRFLTYNNALAIPEKSWKELASTNDTLVFYMSGELLDVLVNKLLENGIAADNYLAVIEQATTPLQNVQVFTLGEFNDLAIKPSLLSPAIILIGKVVALHKEFQWIENYPGRHDYFKSLGNKDKQS